MPQGPFTRIAIRRPSGRTEIIGRAGHLDPGKASRELGAFGDVLSVRHEMMTVNGKPQPMAIHGIRK